MGGEAADRFCLVVLGRRPGAPPHYYMLHNYVNIHYNNTNDTTTTNNNNDNDNNNSYKYNDSNRCATAPPLALGGTNNTL